MGLIKYYAKCMVQTMVKTMETLGQRIAKAREKMDWTQEDLAKFSRVPRRTIQNIEYDQVSPRFDNLVAMANALNITLNELMGSEVPQRDLYVQDMAVKRERPPANPAALSAVEGAQALLAIAKGTAERRAVILSLAHDDAKYIETAELPARVIRAFEALAKVL